MLPLSSSQVSSSAVGLPGRTLTRPSAMASADARERRILGRWMATLALIGVMIGLGYVWLRLQVDAAGYRLEATRQAVQRLRQETNELLAEAATLDNSTRLEQLASMRLGLQRPGKDQQMVLP